MASIAETPVLTPTEAPPVEQELTPEEELADLERQALQCGMSEDLFLDIQELGDCPEQIQDRIDDFRQWLR